MPKPPWLNQFNSNWLLPEFRADERELNAPKAKVVIGQFFEVMGATMFKGEYGPNPEGWDVHPDTVLPRRYRSRDILIEIKGGGRAYGFLIDTGQMECYEKMMNGWSPLHDALKKVPFATEADLKPPFHKPMSYYLFFAHDLSSIAKTYTTVDAVIERLCNGVLGAMLVPVAVVHKFTEWFPLRTYAGWAESGSRGGEKHPYFVRLSAYQMQRWVNGITDVHEAFHAMAEKVHDTWDEHAYTINRYHVSTAKVLNHRVNPFVLMVLQEPGSWKGQPKGSREMRFL